jgi:hypothetical protein
VHLGRFSVICLNVSIVDVVVHILYVVYVVVHIVYCLCGGAHCLLCIWLFSAVCVVVHFVY